MDNGEGKSVDLTETPYRLHPVPEWSISNTGWATGPLLRRAESVAGAHRKWLRDRARHPLTDEYAVRTEALHHRLAAVPSRENATAEYLCESLDSGRLKKLLEKVDKGANQEGAISDHLDRVYRLVFKRLRRAGMRTEPPAYWRDTARLEIKRALESR
jgi:hypothetical protein